MAWVHSYKIFQYKNLTRESFIIQNNLQILGIQKQECKQPLTKVNMIYTSLLCIMEDH